MWMNLELIKRIVLIIAFIGALILGIVYTHAPPKPQEIQGYQQAKSEEIVIVIYQTTDFNLAKQQFLKDYPNYLLVDFYVDKEKGVTYIKGKVKK